MLCPPSLMLLWALAGATPPASTSPVESFGTVKRLVEQHDVGSKVALDRILTVPHAFGLGSLSDLRGEITIVDGVAWLEFPPPAGGIPRVTSSAHSNETAAFLVATHVVPTTWRRMTLPQALSLDDLDRTLEGLQGLERRKDSAAPSFPFRIEGRFSAITLAIIDGRLVPAGPGSESAMEKANVLQELGNVDGVLVGFYSPAPDSAFTHAGKHSHVHAVLPAKRATGHAQKFQLNAGATLFLP